jgi:UDP-3-O-[3-hydroxymyristoyl] glucosamine N-acyltransferase
MSDITVWRTAERVAGTVRGDPDRVITGVSAIRGAGDGDLVFASGPRYQTALETTGAGAATVSLNIRIPVGLSAIQVEDPILAMAKARDNAILEEMAAENF